VLLTTQYLDEADRLAGRIAVMDRGVVIAEGTPAELKASVGSGVLHVRLREAGARPRAERVLAGLLDGEPRPGADPAVLSMRAPGPGGAVRALDELARSGIGLASFSLDQPSLDEVFLTLTGRPTTTDDTKENAA
jgi:daunorubicin/doxorubicin transport system ATP-binding protein